MAGGGAALGGESASRASRICPGARRLSRTAAAFPQRIPRLVRALESGMAHSSLRTKRRSQEIIRRADWDVSRRQRDLRGVVLARAPGRGRQPARDGPRLLPEIIRPLPQLLLRGTGPAAPAETSRGNGSAGAVSAARSHSAARAWREGDVVGPSNGRPAPAEGAVAGQRRPD